MFERPTALSETRSEDIAENVRELCKLDPAMFVSRTVAAEVCMEVKVNEVGYAALKLLDKSGDLHFELSTLVEDLLRTFLTTRSLSSISTGDNLLHLFMEYPTADVTVRLVVLIVVFIAAENLHMTMPTIRAKLEGLGMLPLTRRDIYNILVNPFVDKFTSLLDFAKEEVSLKEDGSKGMTSTEIEKLVEEVATKCVEIACKGKLLKKLYESFPIVKNVITNLVLSTYQVKVEDFLSSDSDSETPSYMATLCRDFVRFSLGEVHSLESLMPEQHKLEPMDVDNEALSQVEPVTTTDESCANPIRNQNTSHLGEISQESLTAMIRQDEAVPVRSRRRIMYSYSLSESTGRLHYPHGQFCRLLFFLVG